MDLQSSQTDLARNIVTPKIEKAGCVQILAAGTDTKVKMYVQFMTENEHFLGRGLQGAGVLRIELREKRERGLTKV